jgi:cellulose synthase/poly-beta-1,6-N-acetylglucosamine synthase-like glycosyltransferase
LWCIILLETWITSFFFFVRRGPGFFLFHTVLLLIVYCIYFITSCLSKLHNPTVTRILLKAQWRRYAQNGTLSSAVPLSDMYSSNSNLQIHASQTSGWEPVSTVNCIQQMFHVQ